MREYARLCERLPGPSFIHHRSVPYAIYGEPIDRAAQIEQALRWIPHYVDAFGPYDANTAKYGTIVRFLADHLGLGLPAIASLRLP